jgi:glycosyltransferase involved in cell wall biosynthesis
LNTSFIPIVSIVIPTYNHSNFLSKALESVLDQTYKNWEVIIIDNNSTDDTNKVINKYDDPRIKYLKINNNGVIAKSRNLGIETAKGDWIAFLDSDDWWTNDKLETCLSKIDKTVDLIYHNLEIKYNKSKSNFKKEFFKKKEFLKGRQLKKPILIDLLESGIIKGNAIGNSSVIVRKNILSKIGGISENIKLVGSEDYNTWLRIAQITNQFKYLKKNLGCILIHDTNTSKKDMSISQRQAVLSFMNLFNSQQKLNLEVKLRYISGNYDYLKNNHNNAIKKFTFVLRNGHLHLKLRSLLKIIFIMFKTAGFKRI